MLYPLLITAGIVMFFNRRKAAIEAIKIEPESIKLDPASTLSRLFANVKMRIDNPERLKANITAINFQLTNEAGQVISRFQNFNRFQLTGAPVQFVSIKTSITTANVITALIDYFQTGQNNYQVKLTGYIETTTGRINLNQALNLKS